MRTWTTTQLPESDQFSYWREVLCEAFTSLRSDTDDRTSFPSTVEQYEIAGIAVSDGRSKAQHLLRGAREIRMNSTADLFVNFQLEGTCRFQQDGRTMLARPGDFYLVDTARHFKQEYSDWRVLSLYIPRHMLEPLLVSMNQSTAVRISSSQSVIGAAAWSFVPAMQSPSACTSEAAEHLLVTSLINILAVALGGTPDAKDTGRASVQQGLLRMIRAHVVQHACDPAISVGKVASRFQISPRYLHKLFEQCDESFTQLVHRERLKHCERQLRRTDLKASISAIAFRAGFGDLSSFGRAFRKHYGMSARDYRNYLRRGTEDEEP